MGDEMWFPPGEAAMGRGEEEPAAPDATMLMGDEVLQKDKIRKSDKIRIFIWQLFRVTALTVCADLHKQIMKLKPWLC